MVEQLDLQGALDADDDVALPGAEVVHVLVEPVRPDLRPGLGRGELGIDPQYAADPADAPVHHVADVEFAADLAHVDRLALVGARR